MVSAIIKVDTGRSDFSVIKEKFTAKDLFTSPFLMGRILVSMV